MIVQNFTRLVALSRTLQRLVAHRVINAILIVNKLPRKFVAGGPFASLAILGLKKNSNNSAAVTTKEIFLAKADALFEQAEYRKIYDLLQNYRDNKDVEILWRLCRALYNMSKSASEVEAKKMIYEAYDIANKALLIKEDNYAVHKWYAVLLDAKCSYEGKKSRIQQLHTVKDHLLRASELNPKDATTLYMLGNWCYQVSDLAWYQRKIAAAIFGEPPKSSFDEALQFFAKAEETDPNFYSHNLLLLGKTCLKLNKIDEAKRYLKMASEYPAKNDEDQQTKQEASKLLGNI